MGSACSSSTEGKNCSLEEALEVARRKGSMRAAYEWALERGFRGSFQSFRNYFYRLGIRERDLREEALRLRWGQIAEMLSKRMSYHDIYLRLRKEGVEVPFNFFVRWLRSGRKYLGWEETGWRVLRGRNGSLLIVDEKGPVVLVSGNRAYWRRKD